MGSPQMAKYRETLTQIQSVADRLVEDANAKALFIVDRERRLLAASGDVRSLETTFLAALIAGAPEGPRGLSTQLTQNGTLVVGTADASVYVQLVGKRDAVGGVLGSRPLSTCFGLRVRSASERLLAIVNEAISRVPEPTTTSIACFDAVAPTFLSVGPAAGAEGIPLPRRPASRYASVSRH